MSTPTQPLLWSPAQSLADLDVMRRPDGLVVLVDKRTWLELLVLPQRDAATLAGRIAAKTVDPDRARPYEPGS